MHKGLEIKTLLWTEEHAASLLARRKASGSSRKQFIVQLSLLGLGDDTFTEQYLSCLEHYIRAPTIRCNWWDAICLALKTSPEDFLKVDHLD
jgi:hypothetical protein